MRRGDLVTVALSGDFGKPRPALVIQSDLFDDHETVTVLLLASAIQGTPMFRVLVEPQRENGLHRTSMIMVDKAFTLKRAKVGQPFGRLDPGTMTLVTRSLALFFGLY